MTVIITGLGYFVDMYDLFLFNVVRVQSLKDLGVTGDAITSIGVEILYMQMIGLLLGAIVWGILSDKLGRKVCLFSSILIYSLATLACGFVEDTSTYGWLRFISGFGLAGEVGMGITLITEHMDSKRRGMGVALFAAMGFLGILAASIASETLFWRDAYILGGVAGLILLFTRTLLSESPMFQALNEKTHNRGNFKIILFNPELRKRYFCTILAAAPIPFMVIIYTFAAEIGAAMGISEPLKVSIAGGCFQVFLIISDIFCSAYSDKIRSRKKVIHYVKLACFLVLLAFLILPKQTAFEFYFFICLFGLTLGYWVLINTIAAEQFGTNIRATVATTIPNFVRSFSIVFAVAFQLLRQVDVTFALAVIGITVFTISIVAMRGIEETYGKNLDYQDGLKQHV